MASEATSVSLEATPLAELVAWLGGALAAGSEGDAVRVVASLEHAGEGALSPFTHGRYREAARAAWERGAALLVAAPLASRLGWEGSRLWVHPHAAWALARILAQRTAPELPAAVVAEGSTIHPTAVLYPGVRIGRGVVVHAGAVLGRPGFGWAEGPDGERVAIPQRGGVVVEDDVAIGPLCTVDGGTLRPTRIGRGVKLDAQVHVGHNVILGEGTVVAAQAGFAGSVVVGRNVLVGGQAGLADHVHIGDGARIAAKAGVIGDVEAGAVVAGYPAVERGRWLRALARQLRAAGAA